MQNLRTLPPLSLYIFKLNSCLRTGLSGCNMKCCSKSLLKTKQSKQAAYFFHEKISTTECSGTLEFTTVYFISLLISERKNFVNPNMDL